MNAYNNEISQEWVSGLGDRLFRVVMPADSKKRLRTHKMPTYEYKCLKCNHRFEVFQSMNDAPLKECPVCKGDIKRLIGRGAGFIFKGSGFYCTDYRSQSYEKAAKQDREAATASSTPAEKAPQKSEASASPSAKVS